MSQQTADDPFEATRMSLGEHLEELRRRLIYSVAGLTLVFTAGWIFRVPISGVVLRPLHQAVGMLNEDLVEIRERQLEEDPTLSSDEYFVGDYPNEKILLKPIPHEPRGDGASTGFFFDLKVCMYFSFFVGGPFVLWQIWQFVAAGLYQHERKQIGLYFPISALLFVGGIVFGYFVMVPYAQYYLASTTLGRIEYYPEIGKYFTFLKGLSLALGVVFQLPIVMFALTRLGLVEPNQYTRYRGHFVVGALIVAAILTPPDPITQMMMAVPMAGLYELGIVVARVAKRQRQRDSATGLA